MLTVNDGIRSQILEVDWHSICGSITSTQDIEDTVITQLLIILLKK